MRIHFELVFLIGILTLNLPDKIATAQTTETELRMKMPANIQEAALIRPNDRKTFKDRPVTPKEYSEAVERAALLFSVAIQDWGEVRALLEAHDIKGSVPDIHTTTPTASLEGKNGKRYEVNVRPGWRQGVGQASWVVYDEQTSQPIRLVQFDLRSGLPEHVIDVQGHGSAWDFDYRGTMPNRIMEYRNGYPQGVWIRWDAKGNLVYIWFAEEPTIIRVNPPSKRP